MGPIDWTLTLWLVFWIALGLLVLLLTVVWVYHSFYLIGTSDKIYIYRTGTYRYTVVNSTYLAWYNERAPQAVRNKGGDVRPSILHRFGIDIAFGLWPLDLGYRVSTTQFEVPIHASQMYTEAGPATLPRVRIEGDATWQLRLSENPVDLGLAFKLFEYNFASVFDKRQRDLTQTTTLTDYAPSVSPEGARHHHQVKRIAFILHNTINKPTLQAMRVASPLFHFSVTQVDGMRDIMLLRREFEREVKSILVEEPDNIFRQGGLLRSAVEEDVIAVETGTSLIVCNLVVELIQLQPAVAGDSEAMRAVDYAFIGRQEGLRQRVVEHLRRLGEARGQRAIEQLRRIGQKQGIDALAIGLGLENEKQRAFLLDVLRERAGNVNLTSVGLQNVYDVLTAIERMMSGGT